MIINLISSIFGTFMFKQNILHYNWRVAFFFKLFLHIIYTKMLKYFENRKFYEKIEIKIFSKKKNNFCLFLQTQTNTFIIIICLHVT